MVTSVRECEHYTTRSLALKVRTRHTSGPPPAGEGSHVRLNVFLQCGNQTRVLQHYWYTSWPDHKTPDSAMPLLQLMTDVETDRRTAAAAGPVIVHCRYGGRENKGRFCLQKQVFKSLPTLLCSQRRDRPDRLLHRYDDRLPTAAGGGSGGRAEHHLPAPS